MAAIGDECMDGTVVTAMGVFETSAFGEASTKSLGLTELVKTRCPELACITCCSITFLACVNR